MSSNVGVRGRAALRAAVEGLLRPGGVVPHFQPIVRLVDGEIIGYEALARMPGLVGGPDKWLTVAEQVGLRTELELRCLEAVAEEGPPPGGGLLFVNLSPTTLHAPGMTELREALADHVVLELTEREAVLDYDDLRAGLRPWVARGARLAVDDAGTGYSSLEHVVELRPDFLKLAGSLVAGIDRDFTRQAMLRAIVAFAREVGSVIVAEGVERYEELEALHDADVDFVQGYLLARPAPPWTELTRQPGRRGLPSDTRPVSADGSRLVRKLTASTDAQTACAAVVEHLFRRGTLLPSIYLMRGAAMRCIAQRGYWQVLDGFPPGAGVIGTTFLTGAEQVIGAVDDAEAFLEAIPGIRSEVCVPLRVDGEIVGVVNVESPAQLDPDLPEEVRRCAGLLARRLSEIGLGEESRSQRLARHAARLAVIESASELQREVVEVARDIAGLDSALIATYTDGRLAVTASAGRLAPAFERLDADTLAMLAGWVGSVTSCYTAGTATGMGFIGHEVLRDAGAGTVAVLPLGPASSRLGILVLAHSQVVPLDIEEVEVLELLAAHAAGCLKTVRAVSELRDQAASDPLTGLGHHGSFQLALAGRREALGVGRHVGVLFVDLDGFKQVNDTHGHAAGDALLRGMATALLHSLRRGDDLFRVGGDEFAALVEVSDLEEAMAVADRLLEAARSLGCTVSIGVALALPDESDSVVMAHSDHALYAVKRSGRDGAQHWSALHAVPTPRPHSQVDHGVTA